MEKHRKLNILFFFFGAFILSLSGMLLTDCSGEDEELFDLDNTNTIEYSQNLEDKNIINKIHPVDTIILSPIE